MKLLASLLIFPALALAGAYSGTVIALDGTPVSGAVIKVGTDSVTTTPNGSWVLARTTGIDARIEKTTSVTSHLTVENGRPRLSFGGMDITGRSSHKAWIGQIPSNVAAARNQAASDTLKVYWKGKRLTVLPVPSDTGSLTFRIDTAWHDDAGIQWNPRITYSSLFDTRDGQTYRTVAVGKQTWMAENLNYAGNATRIGTCYENSSDSCKKYGNLVTWTVAMNGSVTEKSQGICPSLWHIPSDSEWTTLTTKSLDSATAGNLLKSVGAWASQGNGTDQVGLRILPSGTGHYEGSYFNANTHAYLWSSSINTATTAWGRLLYFGDSTVARTNDDRNGYSYANAVRCIKD